MHNYCVTRSSLCSSCRRTLNYSVVHVPIQHIIYMMAKLVVKSVTHDQALQWEQWFPCRRWKATGLCWMCTGRQLYSGEEACCVESAWHNQSFSLWFRSHSGWLSLPGPVWPHQSVSLNLGGILGCPIWLKHAPNFVMGSPIGLCNATLTYHSFGNTHAQCRAGSKVASCQSATGTKFSALLYFAPKTFETNELEHAIHKSLVVTVAALLSARCDM